MYVFKNILNIILGYTKIWVGLTKKKVAAIFFVFSEIFSERKSVSLKTKYKEMMTESWFPPYSKSKQVLCWWPVIILNRLLINIVLKWICNLFWRLIWLSELDYKKGLMTKASTWCRGCFPTLRHSTVLPADVHVWGVTPWLLTDSSRVPAVVLWVHQLWNDIYGEAMLVGDLEESCFFF